MPYVDQHQHPGEMPEKPETLPLSATEEERAANAKKTALFNAWVLANRRHLVAVSLDTLEKEIPFGRPVERIVFVLGLSWLEGSNARAMNADLFSFLLGGL